MHAAQAKLNVVDSSAWLEYFTNADAAQHFADAIEQHDKLVVPSICILEVFKTVLKQVGEGPALQAIALMLQGEVVDLSPEVAVAAARLGVEYRLPLADSVVYATSQGAGAVLWTQDAHFDGLPDVKYFSKPPRTTPSAAGFMRGTIVSQQDIVAPDSDAWGDVD